MAPFAIPTQQTSSTLSKHLQISYCVTEKLEWTRRASRGGKKREGCERGLRKGRRGRERECGVGVSFPCGPHRFNAIIWAEDRGIRVISEKEARKGPVSKGSKLLRPLFFLDTFRSSYFSISFPFSFYEERDRERDAFSSRSRRPRRRRYNITSSMLVHPCPSSVDRSLARFLPFLSRALPTPPPFRWRPALLPPRLAREVIYYRFGVYIGFTQLKYRGPTGEQHQHKYCISLLDAPAILFYLCTKPGHGFFLTTSVPDLLGLRFIERSFSMLRHTLVLEIL